MDDAFRSRYFSSPFGGEEKTRPPDSPEFDLNRLSQLIRRVLGLPDSRIGLLSCTDQLIHDISENAEIHGAWSEWLTALKRLRQVEGQRLGHSTALDRQILSSTGLPILKLFGDQFSGKLSREQKKLLRKIRAALTLAHLSRNAPIPDGIIKTFHDLVTTNTATSANAAMALHSDPAHLAQLRNTYPPDADVARFLTNVIEALQVQLSSPPVLPKNSKPKIFTVRKNGLNEDKSNQSAPDETAAEDPDLEEPQKPFDLIFWYMTEAGFALPRDHSGIANLWKSLDSLELKHLVADILPLLLTEERQPACAIFLTLLTRARPKYFDQVPIGTDSPASIWLDLQAGHICWRSEIVMDSDSFCEKEREYRLMPLRIPLPAELATALLELARERGHVNTLADLFEFTPEELDSRVAHFLHISSVTSHRWTLGRIRNTWGRFLISVCHDETYSSALSLDLSLGTTASFNYCTFSASRINEIVSQAYQSVGLSGDVLQSALVDVLPIVPVAAPDVDRTLVDALQSAANAFESVRHRYDEASLKRAHNTISISLLTVLCIVTGHRSRNNHSFARHTMDLNLLLALIADKVSPNLPYCAVRLVPIPSVISSWLSFYLSWLKTLAYRYQKIDKNVSSHIHSLISSTQDRAAIPLFFVFHASGQIRGATNADVYPLFAKYGLETNAGRSWGDTIIRNADFDSAVVMAWLGHSANGQEASGVRSALPAIRLCNAARAALDAHLAELPLPLAPTIAPRHSELPKLPTNRHSPGGFDAAAAIANETAFERCPFSEMTLSHFRQFRRLVNEWHRQKPSVSIGDIAFSFVANDGIANVPEILGVVKECLSGTFFNCKGSLRIDTNTETLGIRPVTLHPETIWLVSKFCAANGVASNISDKQISVSLASTLARLEAIHGKEPPLTYLASRAQAVYTIATPGVIRGYADGSLHSRALRIEALARHETGFIEHPNFTKKTRRRRTLLTNDQFIRDAIKNANQTGQNKGSDKYRQAELQKELETYDVDDLDGGPLQIQFKFALHLSKSVKSPSTVLRYYLGISDFIFECFSHLESADDISDFAYSEISRRFETYLAQTDRTSTPETVALNHLMEALGIDLRLNTLKDPAASARKYLDQPSQSEIARAIQIVLRNSKSPEDHKMLAKLALDLIPDAQFRWYEFKRLRLCDLYVSNNTYVVSTQEASGNTKSSSGNRIIVMRSSNTVDQLTKLADIRRQQYPSCQTANLFCDRGNPITIDDTAAIYEIISDALYAASGSDALSVHGCRGVIPTSELHRILDPDVNLRSNPLELRQVLYAMAGRIGHGDVLTTIGQYCWGLDALRQKWWGFVTKTYLGEPSFEFLSELLNIPADSLRARVRRNSKKADASLLDTFAFQLDPAIGHRIRNLSEFVVDGTESMDLEGKATYDNVPCSQALYTAVRLATQNADLAAFSSAVTVNDRSLIEQGLAFLHQANHFSCDEMRPIDVRNLQTDALLVELAIAFATLEVSKPDSLRLVSIIGQPGTAWEIRNLGDAKLLTRVLSRLDADHLDILVSRRTGEQIDPDVQKQLIGRNFRHYTIHRRWFGKDVLFRIQMVPHGTTKSAWTTKTRYTTYILSAVILSRCLTTLGDSP